jgi:pimeloyl-ACP methyl ester carboxylesterase
LRPAHGRRQDADVHRPETRFAENDAGLRLAYQVVGDGPVDLLFLNPWFTDLELQWEEPGMAAFLERLASFSRLILVDKCGMGRSSRVPPDALPSIDGRVADLGVVLDAVGAGRATVASASESGPLAMAFSAANPERVRGLVVYACRARYGAPLPDYPFGYAEEELLPWLEQLHEQWGTRAFAQEFYDWMAPNLATDPVAVDWLARMMPVSADPDTVVAATRLTYATDVRAKLPSIHCPALVLARRGDVLCPFDEVAWLSDHIDGARFVPLDGDDHPFWAGDTSVLLDELEAFVRGLGP